ncbi:MAG: hypothetical protein ACKVYV_01570 [Limisphaerales bacterium]
MKPVAPLLAASLLLALPASAAVSGTALGTAAPPAPPLPVLGAEGDVTSSVATPFGGISFDLPLEIAQVGGNWSTWSHGFAGKVYATDPNVFPQPTSLTIDLPPNVESFFFYIEPNAFFTPLGNPIPITAQALGGAPVLQNISGNGGASGFLFTGTGGDFITRITVSISADAEGWAIGELGIVPEGDAVVAGAALAGLALAGWLRRRRA